jgi:RNase P subunit RPR2
MNKEEQITECNRCKKVLTEKEENYIRIEVNGNLAEEEKLLILCRECTVDFLITIKNFIK